jgi:hypothetical protein
MSPRVLTEVFAAVLLSCVAGCGGTSEEVTPPDAPQTEAFSILVGEEPIALEAPTTILVQIVVIGARDQPVSLSSPHLPAFVELSGSVLRLSPGYGDAGEHAIPLKATAGDKTTSATLRLHITRKNTPPMWLPSPRLWVDHEWKYLFEFPTVTGTPLLQAFVCDKEGDDITLEAEVVPKGQPSPHAVTYVRTVSFKEVPPLPYYPNESCAEFQFQLTGLSPSVTYRVALRTHDSLGAVDSYGWVDFGGFTLQP